MFQQYLLHQLSQPSPLALLFPAVNSRRRFLIHHTVADYFPNLASLSVGEGEQRRTAVTLKQQLEQHQLLQEKHRREEQLLREDEERERQRERQQRQEATATQRGRNSQQEQQRRECSQESNNTIDRKQRNRHQQQYRNSPETQDSDTSSRQQQRGKNRNNKENADGEERQEPEKKEGRRRNRKRDKRGSSSALSLHQKEQEEQQGNSRNRRQHQQQQQEQDDTRVKQTQQSKNPRGGENFGGNPIRKSASSSAVLCPTEDGEGGCSSSEQPERKASKRRRRDTKRRNRNNNEKNKKDGEEDIEEYEDRKGSRAQSRESSAKPKENAKSQHQEHLEVSSVNGECQSECRTSKGRKRGSRRSPSKPVPVPPESNGSEHYNADRELAPPSRANTVNSIAPSASSAGRKVKRSASSVSSISNCECDPRRDGPERRDQRSTPERSKALGSWRIGEGVTSSPSPSSSSNASSRRGSSTQAADRSREEQPQNQHHAPFHHHHHHPQQQHQSYRRSSIGPVAPESTTPTTSCNSYPCDCSPSGSKSSFGGSGCVMPVNMTADLEINNKVKRGKGVSAAIYRPPPARRDGPLHPSPRVRLDSQGDLIQTSTPTSSVSRPRAKRPDQQLYVPKGRRYGPHDAPTPDMEPRPPSPAYSVASESSGRNRYNSRSQQGSHLSIYDEDLDEHSGVPLHNDLRDLSRESTPAYGNNKGNPGTGLFSKQTLQLIERCMNQDRQDSWENSSVNSSPSPKNNRRYSNGGANVCKSPTPKRDLDSVHSKENVLLPNDQVPTRTRKNRRNRRRGSRSRDQLNDQSNKDQSSRTPQRNTPNSTSGSSEWVFYNSSYDYNNDRYDNRGYDNYDRYSSSRNNSKASSRNSSRERQQQYQHHQQSNSSHYTHLDWRNRGNNVNTSYSIPSSPAKGYTHPGYQHSRNSAKPPSGRLGSLPNVALDFGDTRRRSLTEQTASNSSPKNTSPRAPKSIEESSSTSMSPHSYVQPSRTPCSSLNTSCSSNSSPHTVPDTHEHFTPVMSDISERVEPPSANQDQTSSNSQTIDSNTQVISSQEHGVSPSIEQVVSASNQNYHMDTHSYSPSDSSHTTDHTLTERVDEVNHHQTEDNANDLVNSDLAEEEESKPEEVQKEETKDEGEKPAEEETTPPKEELKKNPKKFSFNWADEVEDSWDSMYDETGECLDPELKKQLDSTVGKVTFEEPEHDYYNYQAKDSSPVLINDAEYSHVIEIYDFPVSFKTQDLLSIFGNFQNTGFDIKWVDDTHALGVFTTALIASEALNIDHPFLKTRPLTLATRASKAKALRITEALLPYKPRPETSAALARRLVSGALGLKVNVSREVREAEKQKLKDAKAKKRLAAKQREDAWEGTIV